MITLTQITSLSEIIEQKDYIVLSTKTTGPDPESDRLVEVGMLRVADDRIVRQNSTLIDPEMPIPADASALHGIGDEDVSGAPTYEQLAPSFAGILLGQTVVSHDAELTLSFIVDMLEGFGYDGELRYIDTLECAKAAFPRLRDHELPSLASALGVQSDGVFTALDDAHICFDVLSAYKAQPEPEDDAPVPQSVRRRGAASAPEKPADGAFEIFGFSIQPDTLWWVLFGICLLASILLLPAPAGFVLLLTAVVSIPLPIVRELLGRVRLSGKLYLFAVAGLLLIGLILTPFALKSRAEDKPKDQPPTQTVETAAPIEIQPTEPSPEPTVAPTPVPEYPRTGYISGEGVNFRTEANTQSRIIATYKRGKEVTVTGMEGDWAAVTIDGKTGYVSARYITFTKPE